MELNALNENIKGQVKRGLKMMKSFPDYYAREIDSILAETENNYVVINGLSNVERCGFNQFTKNYSFLLANRASLLKLNECCDAWISGCNTPRKTTSLLKRLLQYFIHGLFPNYVLPTTCGRFMTKMLVSVELAELEKLSFA